jgi:hypothetical protein
VRYVTPGVLREISYYLVQAQQPGSEVRDALDALIRDRIGALMTSEAWVSKLESLRTAHLTDAAFDRRFEAVDGGRQGRGRRARIGPVHELFCCLLGVAVAWMEIGYVRSAISLAFVLPTVNGPQRSVSRESVAAAKRKDTALASITTCCP